VVVRPDPPADRVLQVGPQLGELLVVVDVGGSGDNAQFVFRGASKGGDVSISRHVFEIKATLEKLRELVLNIE